MAISKRGCRAKGHAFERDIANRFKAIYGGRIRRGQQGRDGADAPDVMGVPRFWVECKRQIKPNILAALRQAEDAADAAGDPRSCVAVTKGNRDSAVVTLRLTDFLALIRELDGNATETDVPAGADVARPEEEDV